MLQKNSVGAVTAYFLTTCILKAAIKMQAKIVNGYFKIILLVAFKFWFQ